jgi:hypothetical protein
MNEAQLAQLIAAAMVSVPVITAIVTAFRGIPWVADRRYTWPFIAMVTGVVINILFGMLGAVTAETPLTSDVIAKIMVYNGAVGLIAGLASSGLWSGFKAMQEGLQDVQAASDRRKAVAEAQELRDVGVPARVVMVPSTEPATATVATAPIAGNPPVTLSPPIPPPKPMV